MLYFTDQPEKLFDTKTNWGRPIENLKLTIVRISNRDVNELLEFNEDGIVYIESAKRYLNAILSDMFGLGNGSEDRDDIDKVEIKEDTVIILVDEDDDSADLEFIFYVAKVESGYIKDAVDDFEEEECEESRKPGATFSKLWKEFLHSTAKEAKTTKADDVNEIIRVPIGFTNHYNVTLDKANADCEIYFTEAGHVSVNPKPGDVIPYQSNSPYMQIQNGYLKGPLNAPYGFLPQLPMTGYIFFDNDNTWKSFDERVTGRSLDHVTKETVRLWVSLYVSGTWDKVLQRDEQETSCHTSPDYLAGDRTIETAILSAKHVGYDTEDSSRNALHSQLKTAVICAIREIKNPAPPLRFITQRLGNTYSYQNVLKAVSDLCVQGDLERVIIGPYEVGYKLVKNEDKRSGAEQPIQEIDPSDMGVIVKMFSSDKRETCSDEEKLLSTADYITTPSSVKTVGSHVKQTMFGECPESSPTSISYRKKVGSDEGPEEPVFDKELLYEMIMDMVTYSRDQVILHYEVLHKTRKRYNHLVVAAALDGLCERGELVRERTSPYEIRYKLAKKDKKESDLIKENIEVKGFITRVIQAINIPVINEQELFLFLGQKYCAGVIRQNLGQLCQEGMLERVPVDGDCFGYRFKEVLDEKQKISTGLRSLIMNTIKESPHQTASADDVIYKAKDTYSPSIVTEILTDLFLTGYLNRKEDGPQGTTRYEFTKKGLQSFVFRG